MMDFIRKVLFIAVLFGGGVEAVDFNYRPSVDIPLPKTAEYGIETFSEKRGTVIEVTVRVDQVHGDICAYVDVLASTYRNSVPRGKDVVPVPLVRSENKISLRVSQSEYTNLRVDFLCDDDSEISSYNVVFGPEQES